MGHEVVECVQWLRTAPLEFDRGVCARLSSSMPMTGSALELGGSCVEFLIGVRMTSQKKTAAGRLGCLLKGHVSAGEGGCLEKGTTKDDLL
jgi:hypothetical protein